MEHGAFAAQTSSPMHGVGLLCMMTHGLRGLNAGAGDGTVHLKRFS